MPGNNNFYVFDENENNIMSVADYQTSSTRSNGVVSGIADSQLHNRLYKQLSMMVTALGQIIADSGLDASDGSLSDLVSALKSTLVTKSSSGVTPVDQGGTGASSFTSNAVLTGNGTSSIVAKATADGAAYATTANGPLQFGTLPAAQGGTGQTSLQAARNAMGLGNTTGALPVENGGTGQTTLTANALLKGNGTSGVAAGPVLGSSTTTYLRNDGQWVAPANTTYTFTGGTNKFTVTPAGGTATDVAITPSITNNITGSGTRTSGYIAKFSGQNTITNGPAIGTSTTTFLRNDGSWATPAGTYSLPTMSTSTRGGAKLASDTAQSVAANTVSSTASRTYAIQKNSSEQLVVNVPWTDTITGTTYNAGSAPANTNFGTNGSIKNVYDSIGTKLNRTDNLTASNTSYTTYMARSIAAGTTDMTDGSSTLTSGAIYLYYEA